MSAVLRHTLDRLAFALAQPLPASACRLCIELTALKARRSYCDLHLIAKLLRVL
jgi:hypothetical protein